jgi:hypothetical protein
VFFPAASIQWSRLINELVLQLRADSADDAARALPKSSSEPSHSAGIIFALLCLDLAHIAKHK